jgi:hypothetical protein
MESREEELMRKRMATEQYRPWNLSFEEEGGNRGIGSTNVQPLRWEVTNYRGMDMVRNIGASAKENKQIWQFSYNNAISDRTQLTLISSALVTGTCGGVMGLLRGARPIYLAFSPYQCLVRMTYFMLTSYQIMGILSAVRNLRLFCPT